MGSTLMWKDGVEQSCPWDMVLLVGSVWSEGVVFGFDFWSNETNREWTMKGQFVLLMKFMYGFVIYFCSVLIDTGKAPLRWTHWFVL